jgi:hypothetical protein
MLQLFPRYWELIIASVLALVILLFAVFRLVQDSRRGRLSSALTELREREQSLQSASRNVAKALLKYEKIASRGDKVPPNKLLAAKDALAAARETERLLGDQVLVLRNNARTIILQDYPPAKHAAMRRRHLGETDRA